jgi:hypothetical protein
LGIFPEGVNLIPFELSVLASGGEADCSAAGIDFHGNLDAAFKRVPEELPHHLDHIVVSVIVVIPKNNVVGRLPFGPTGLRVIEFSFVELGLGHRSNTFRRQNLTPLSLPSFVNQMRICDHFGFDKECPSHD